MKAIAGISTVPKPIYMTCVGVIYYEKQGVEDLVTFTAAANLNNLIEVYMIV